MQSSKTYQYRKVVKPQLERQRRARINKCLDQLKDLMIDCIQQDNNENVIRLEKADILEYTVEYLRKIRSSQKQSSSCNDNFRNGYIYAANEISKAMASTRGIDIKLGTHLMTHLGYKLNEMERISTPEVHISQREKLSVRTMNEKFCGTLKIETFSDDECDELVSLRTSSISRASSGYQSDSTSRSDSVVNSPVTVEESFARSLVRNLESHHETVWRPW